MAVDDAEVRRYPLFLEDEDGGRRVFGGIERFQRAPPWHGALLFHEYFHARRPA